MVLFAVATVLCYIPGLVTDISGIAMVAALVLWQKRKNKLEVGIRPLAAQ
jgi:UPF0716 family protein affecting phage T7 exclusion